MSNELTHREPETEAAGTMFSAQSRQARVLAMRMTSNHEGR